VNIFNNYSLIKSIKSYNYSNIYNNYFYQLTSFNYICTSLSGYIVIDYGNSNFGYYKIIEFDTSFKFIRSYFLYHPHSIITVNNSNTIEIYVSSYYGVYKFNISLAPIGYYYRNFRQYSGIYYNQTGDYILACSDAYSIEFLRRDDLTFIKYISTKPYLPTDIREYNGTLFVGTTNSTVLIIKDEIISSLFNTICNSIISLAIDIVGNIAIVCNSFIHLYSTNGTYLNVAWASQIGNITSIGFDGFGNFVVTAYNGIHIFH
jgi:hypothetical protein